MGLLERFSRYVVQSYGGDGSAVSIKFEAIGHPVEAQDVSDYAFSRLANVFPRPDSDVFVEASQALDALTQCSSTAQRSATDPKAPPSAR